ncbi:MAG TPA: DUF2254 domain-containing protein [Gemmatimonadales bacterium]|nr:DUF2254 domain-containing protein [Gemmatimonadales bacterium]
MADLLGVWARLRESLWFVPSLIVLTAVLLAVAMVELSGFVTSDVLERWPRLFGAGAEGARGMLSAIASSMITVAGVTFSITMVAVTQASTQYSPRILRNFMRDRANQAVLGIFVGIFAYCLVVLRTIRGGDESPFVPSIAVLVGILLALLGIAVLIFFIHHIATTLQASEIIARIARETCDTVDQLFPDEIEEAAPAQAAPIPQPATGPWSPVAAEDTGYIQRADVRRLVRIADQHDLLVKVERAAGDFVIGGQPMVWFASVSRPSTDSLAATDSLSATDSLTATGSPAGSERGGEPSVVGGSGATVGHPRAAGGERAAADAIGRLYSIGTYRTLDHDARFGMRQLVDIALKALSPGVNDTTTAVTCVDYLGAVLLRLTNRRIDVLHLGPGGQPRVLATGPTYEDLLDLAMDEVRQNADGHVSVLVRQLRVLGTVAAVSRSVPRRRALAKHAELLREAAVKAIPLDHDRAHIDAAARAALAAAGRP